jgi:thiol-disulfide isomerase/thioredoxin
VGEVVPGPTPEVTGAGATTDDAVAVIDAAGLAELLAPGPARVRARIVALFATWCIPCEVELVQLTRLSSAAGAELIVVSLDAPGVEVGAWLSARGVRARAYHLPEAAAAAAIFALAPDWPQTLPVSFVLPRDGRPTRRFDGVAPAEAIEALVR